MKIETYIIILDDRKQAERLKNTPHTSLDKLKGVMANDGVEYLEIIPITDFMDNWNNSDDDTETGIANALQNHFITYVNIVE